MKTSKPECKNYIAEDLCAASPNRPEEHCHDDSKGDCGRFADVEAPAKTETSKKKMA
jgi:hypothetical protein